MVDLGDGKPVKWGDHRQSAYMPRADYDRGVQFLTKVAENFDRFSQGTQGQRGQQGQRQGQQQQRGQGQPQGQTSKDLFEQFDDMAVVDGRSLAKIGRQLISEGLAPLGQAYVAMGKKLETMEQRLAAAEGTAGSLRERESAGDFDRHVTDTLSHLPEIKSLGTVDPNNPLVREIAKDVWLSHDQKDPSLARDFPKMVQERLEGLFTLFTKMQGDFVKAAKDKQRNFFNPARGGGQGSGGAAYEHLNGSQIAARAREAGLWDNRHNT